MGFWQIGDVKCVLERQLQPGLFTGTWGMKIKPLKNKCYVTFEGLGMSVQIENISNGNVELLEKDVYLKTYPTSTGSTMGKEWSGTGFALKGGLVCTNYHVIEGAKNIKVVGVGGKNSNAFSAEVVGSDKVNDLAILKITDSRFSSFGQIPYGVKTSMDEVGEEVFVLGFPMTSTMGEEIKLTTGVISSRTGFQGDVSLYQISAPVQPGNSGGPLFDSKGYLIGVVCAKHGGAENVSYAVKASYLQDLLRSSLSTDVLPVHNGISSLSLSGEVSQVKSYVFRIQCKSE